MRTTPLTDHFGVRIEDFSIDVLRTDDGVATLREAFDAGVVVIPGQELTDDLHDALVGTLGQLHTFPSGRTAEYMSNVVEEEHNIAGTRRLLFHNDGSYGEHVAPGTCLYALEVSPTSPPTAFADTVRGYRVLPDDVREAVDALHGVHTFNVTAALQDEDPERYRVAEHDIDEDVQLKTATHPAVIDVPHTGERALFVSEFNTSHFAELGPDSDEGEALLQTLFSVLYAEDNVYTHHYEVGDVVIWNNLATQHARVARIDDNPRTFRRIVVSELAW